MNVCNVNYLDIGIRHVILSCNLPVVLPLFKIPLPRPHAWDIKVFIGCALQNIDRSSRLPGDFLSAVLSIL